MVYIQLVDKHGQAVPLADYDTAFIDLVTEAIVEKGVGFLRTEKHVKGDILAALTDVIYDGTVVIHPLKQRECPTCHTTVNIWKTYVDGSISCTDTGCSK